MSFGERLKELREGRGLSQKELAERINKLCSSQLKRNTISNYERGKSFPNYNKLIALVNILDTTSDNLLDIVPQGYLSNTNSHFSKRVANSRMAEVQNENDPIGSLSSNFYEHSQMMCEVKYISVKEHYSYAKKCEEKDYILSLPSILMPYEKGHIIRAFQVPSPLEHLFINVLVKYGDILIGEKASDTSLTENVSFYITVWSTYGIKIMRKFELKQLVDLPEIQEIWVPKAIITYDEYYRHY